MRKKAKKRHTSFDTLCTVLITLLVVAIVFVFTYSWRTLGFSSHTVSYSSAETDIIGSLPEDRKFDKGDEVVVRAGSFTREDYTFVGWKDVNNVTGYTGSVLPNGTVFVMPDGDVAFEAVWKETAPVIEEDNTETTDDTTEVFYKKDGKDYVNVRSDYNYTSEVVTKVTKSNTEIHYSGKSETVYDEDDYTNYTWYYVTIPDLNEEGWIRSDMLSKKADSKSKEKSFVKSSKVEVLSLYKEADSSSDIIGEVEDDETILYFNGESEKTTDKNGNSVTWYLVKDSSTGRSGWTKYTNLEAFEN